MAIVRWTCTDRKATIELISLTACHIANIIINKCVCKYMESVNIVDKMVNNKILKY